MTVTCEAVRDRLPAVWSGQLVGPEAQAVLGHLRECAECAAEAALVQALRQAPSRAPAGLAERIRQAAGHTARARYSWRRPALLAAAVMSVLLGASLLMRGGPGPAASPGAPSSPQASATPAPATGGSASRPLAVTGPRVTAPVPDGRSLMQALPGTADAGLYSSTATLEDLSEEELNTLLKELQS